MQSAVDKLKPQTVSFSELIKLGLTKNCEWPDEEIFLDFSKNWVFLWKDSVDL